MDDIVFTGELAKEEDQIRQGAEVAQVLLYARKIPHLAIVRGPGLLPMWYRPQELADELGVEVMFVRDWLRRGLAFRKDARGHIWIDGREAARWIETHRRSSSGGPLPDGWAYCMRCRARIEIARPVRMVSGKHLVLSGTCPRCGGKVYRGARNGPPRELPSGQIVP